eukprot:scaffold111741_cov67-Phaeocystis_antarctica.AAC.6
MACGRQRVLRHQHGAFKFAPLGLSLVSLPQAMQLSRRHAAAAAASLALAVLAAIRLRRRHLAAAAATAAAPHIITTAAAAEAACAEWLHAIRAGRLPAVIGLDAEWVKGQPPALLQLSCGSARRTLLLRLCAFRHEPPPPSLCALLCDGAILKAGVGVVADLVRLEAALGLAVTRGGVELSSVVALDPALHGMAGGLPALTLSQA